MTTPDLRIYVTAKDIREGRQREPGACPVSRAIRRAIARQMPGLHPECVEVIVNAVATHQMPNGDWAWTTWVLPMSAKRFIGEFDLGLEVKPFSATLRTIISSSHYRINPSYDLT